VEGTGAREGNGKNTGIRTRATGKVTSPTGRVLTFWSWCKTEENNP